MSAGRFFPRATVRLILGRSVLKADREVSRLGERRDLEANGAIHETPGENQILAVGAVPERHRGGVAILKLRHIFPERWGGIFRIADDKRERLFRRPHLEDSLEGGNGKRGRPQEN